MHLPEPAPTGGRLSIRIQIIDQSPIVRLGFRHLASPDSGLEIVADLADVSSLIDTAGQCRPDVIVVGEGSSSVNRGALLGKLHRIALKLPVILNTFGPSPDEVGNIISAGIAGILHYCDCGDHILCGIRSVLAGEVFVSSLIPRSQHLRQRDSSEREIQVGLSSREVEVLRLLVTGMTNKQVAASFSLSVRTVESHRARMMAKLRLHSAAQLAHFALSQGITPAPLSHRYNEDRPQPVGVLRARRVNLGIP
jgi:DNA-binding NarL/FixJ family response regulator